MDTFDYQGRTYRLYPGLGDERIVELPLAIDWIGQKYGLHVLEVGNVLSHYYEVRYDVLDKYETTRATRHVNGRLINEDAAFWRPANPYDFIVSVSTLEHMGERTDVKRDGYKPLAAIYNLLLYGLVPGGRLFLTWPWGYHKMLDDMARRRSLDFAMLGGLHRTGKRRWTECAIEDLEGVRYNRPFPKGNGVVVAEIQTRTRH